MTTTPDTSKVLEQAREYPPMPNGEALARFFHETYERLAPKFGYETRTDTREFDPASKNGQLMIAVAGEVYSAFADATVALRGGGGTATCPGSQNCAAICGEHPACALASQAAPASGVLSDEQAEQIIRECSGEWHEDVFHVEGPELMAMLRKAAALSLEGAPQQAAGASTRIKLLERALVYSAHHQHGTPLHQLPQGIALLDAEGVIVTLPTGEKVEAWDRPGSSVEGAEPTGATSSKRLQDLRDRLNVARSGRTPWLMEDEEALEVEIAQLEGGGMRFDKTYCSQCGGEFGPGNAGFSHCADHRLATQAERTVSASGAAAPAMGADALDAKRYRWLCEKFGVTKLPCAIERILEGTYVADGKGSIDAAIDEAIRAARKTEGGV